MSSQVLHDFGVVDEKADFFVFHITGDKIGKCSLEEVRQTERGPRRTEISTISSSIWNVMAERVIRELITGMGDTEKGNKIPTLKTGANRLSAFLGRELAVLFWPLMEEGGVEHAESILHGWRELAREERWWLFSRAYGSGQRQGVGWRRALYHALAETADSRSIKKLAEKKSPKSISPKRSPLSTTKSSPSKQPKGSRRNASKKKQIKAIINSRKSTSPRPLAQKKGKIENSKLKKSERVKKKT